MNLKSFFWTLSLSLLLPGMGQIYAGHLKRGIIINLCWLFLILLFFLVLYSSFHGLVFFILTLIFLVIVASADSLYIKIKGKKQANLLWFCYLSIIVVDYFIVLPAIIIFLNPIKLFRIPSDSMAPTFIIGDYFVADKKYYKRKIPDRGDIVVFRSPIYPSMYFVKRVIGLPGEKIEARGWKVFINGRLLYEPYIRISDEQMKRFSSYSRRYVDPNAIPSRKLFVLGDNRPGSYDSRDYRYIDVSSLKGKALYLFWSRDRKKIGADLSGAY